MTRRKLIWRSVFAAAGFVLAAGLAAPYFNVSQYGKSIQRSLESALGRKVEIGEARLNLFQGPGVSIDNVVIHENPSVGIEPLVYVTGSLEARVSLRSLWTGRLEFSSLRLDEPSINVVRLPGGTWNIEPLVTRTVGVAKASRPGAHIPDILIRDGRINFRSGDTKSAYYLTNADVDILPQGGQWRFSFRGEPARTDRPAHGFGEVSGRGRWIPDARTGGHVEMAVNLERSRIAELATLVHGRDLGVHGFVSGSARLKGPISDMAIDGRLQVADIHRWDLLPSHDEAWPLDFRGRLDLASQRLEIDTVGGAQAPVPFNVRFRASDYLSQPHWGLVVYLNRLPVRAFPAIAKQLGVAVPDGLAVEGDIDGALGYSPDSGFQGTVAARDASLRLGEAPPLKVLDSRLLIDGRRVHFGPAELETAGNQNATFEADYDRDEFATTLETDGLDIAELQTGLGRIVGTADAPLLKDSTAGRWRGKLSWVVRTDEPGVWTGSGVIENATFAVPGFSAPVELRSAAVALRPDGLDMQKILAKAGEIEFHGDYHFKAKAPRPHQFRFAVEELDGADLESLLQPALERREGLLARALRFGRVSVPGWLRDRAAEGSIEFGSLSLGGTVFENVRGKVRWDGLAAEIRDLRATVAEGTLAGGLAVSLKRAVPSYRADLTLNSVAWRGGKWDTESVVQTSGTGAELLRNLRSEGTFRCLSAELMADTEFRSIAGSYTYSRARRAPVWRFTDVQAILGEDAFTGAGASRDDGRLEFELSDGQRQMRMSGTVSPFLLEMTRAAVQPAAAPK